MSPGAQPHRHFPRDTAGGDADRAAVVSGYLLLAVLTVVWTWWGWRQGAFFGVVFFPGAIALYAVAALLLLGAPWRADLRLQPAALVAIAAIALLGIWTLLSALWSPSPDVAATDAQRAILYGAAFVLGMWLVQLLGRRLHLALLPLGLAAAAVAIGTLLTLGLGDDLRSYLEDDGTLRFPLGYRNANPAFFLVAVWPAVALAAERKLDWRLRGLMLATATASLELAFLSQSRGSVPAAAAAAAVYLLAAPNRLRALAWLALAAVPAAAALPQLLEPYDAAADLGRATIDPLRTAAAAAAVSSAAALVIGALAARLEPDRERQPDSLRAWNRTVLGGGMAVVVAGVVAFGVLVGNPVTWVSDRVSDVRAGGTEESGSGSRLLLSDLRSARNDHWRVAWDQTVDAPLGGGGAGSFQYRYLIDREVDRTPRDAHSVELELLAELGVPGLLLFCTFAVAAVLAALSSRRLGPGAATVTAAALGSATYWLVHASVDWFWAIPALTAPVFALLGAAAAPAILDPEAGASGKARLAAGAIVAVLALTCLPPFLSERYVNDAYRTWPSDLDGAYSDLDRARALNPLSDSPLLAEGAIALEAGDRTRALDAFGDAAEKRPEEWASHYFLARLLARRDPAAALQQAETAVSQNPLSRDARRLRNRIAREVDGSD